MCFFSNKNFIVWIQIYLISFLFFQGEDFNDWLAVHVVDFFNRQAFYVDDGAIVQSDLRIWYSEIRIRSQRLASQDPDPT